MAVKMLIMGWEKRVLFFYWGDLGDWYNSQSVRSIIGRCLVTGRSMAQNCWHPRYPPTPIVPEMRWYRSQKTSHIWGTLPNIVQLLVMDAIQIQKYKYAYIHKNTYNTRSGHGNRNTQIQRSHIYETLPGIVRVSVVALAESEKRVWPSSPAALIQNTDGCDLLEFFYFDIDWLIRSFLF